MRLVGAPEIAVRVPLLLGGMLQGLIGAAVAAVVLVVTHRTMAPRLEPLLTGTLGLPSLHFLPPGGLPTLVVAGTLLGGLGGWLARGRRET
jgi:cell division protein FtsX